MKIYCNSFLRSSVIIQCVLRASQELSHQYNAFSETENNANLRGVRGSIVMQKNARTGLLERTLKVKVESPIVEKLSNPSVMEKLSRGYKDIIFIERPGGRKE